MALYTMVGAVVLVAAIALLVWNSGLLQRSMTALDVNGAKYTAADVQYYYSSIYKNYSGSYYFDPNTSVKKQVYDQESGQSWYDFMLDQAVQTLTNNTALAARAEAEGFALTDESQARLDSFLTQLDSGWAGGGFTSRAAFIKANFGPYMTYDRLTALARQEFLAADYASAQLEAADHPDADYEEYYKEHAGELDTFTYSQFTFRAAADTTDEQGNAIELTDEEKSAQLETRKAEQKALAEEFKTKLEGGADLDELASEYADRVYNAAPSRASTGASVSGAAFGEWLMDSGRKDGDVTIAESDSGMSYYYYVVVFEGRARDEDATHTVRHILLRAGDGSAQPTQEQLDEAEEKAQALLDEWKAGEATQESFAALAAANSADTGSAQNGGLIDEISPSSSYVEPFKDWAVDPARKEGDTGLVQSDYGWHIMYYVSTDDPVWRLDVAGALQQQDYQQLIDSACEGWSISQGMGMSFITA